MSELHQRIVNALSSRSKLCVLEWTLYPSRWRAPILADYAAVGVHGKEIEMRKPTLREVAYVGAGAAALALFYYRNDLVSATSMLSAAGLTGLADQVASRRGKKAKRSKRSRGWWRLKHKPR